MRQSLVELASISHLFWYLPKVYHLIEGLSIYLHVSSEVLRWGWSNLVFSKVSLTRESIAALVSRVQSCSHLLTGLASNLSSQLLIGSGSDAYPELLEKLSDSDPMLIH